MMALADHVKWVCRHIDRGLGIEALGYPADWISQGWELVELFKEYRKCQNKVSLDPKS